MKECIDSIESLYDKYMSLFSRYRTLAHSAAAKLGAPDWIEGMAYVQRLTKKNGKSYVVLELYRESGSRRKIGLGPLEGFSRERMYKVLNERFDLTKDEVDALLIVRYLKDLNRVLERLRYHVERVIELSKNIDVDIDRFINNTINQVKTDYRVAMVW